MDVLNIKESMRIKQNIKFLTIILLAGFIFINLTSIVFGVGEFNPVQDKNIELKTGVKTTQTTEQNKSAKLESQIPSRIECAFGQPYYDANQNNKPIGCLIGSGTLHKDSNGKILTADCPTGSQPYYKDTSGALSIITGGLLGVSAEYVGCIAPASKVIRDQDIKSVGTITLDKYTTSVNIPCQPIAGGTCPEMQGITIAGYIARLYQFGLMIAGLAAFGAIVFGSIKYILSAGSMANQQDARDQITQAIIGLALLLGAYLILYTINPALVSLRNPQMEIINLEGLGGGSDVFGEYSSTQGNQNTPTNSDLNPIQGCRESLNTGITITTQGGTKGGPTCLDCSKGYTKDFSGGCITCEDAKKLGYSGADFDEKCSSK